MLIVATRSNHKFASVFLNLTKRNALTTAFMVCSRKYKCDARERLSALYRSQSSVVSKETIAIAPKVASKLTSWIIISRLN